MPFDWVSVPVERLQVAKYTQETVPSDLGCFTVHQHANIYRTETPRKSPESRGISTVKIASPRGTLTLLGPLTKVCWGPSELIRNMKKPLYSISLTTAAQLLWANREGEKQRCTPKKSGCESTRPRLQVIVSEESSVAVRFQPMVEMNLVQEGRRDLLPQFVGFGANEGNTPSDQH